MLSALLYPDTGLPRRGNTRRLPGKESWKILQPEPAGNIPCRREIYRASRRPRCAERHVVHDSSGRGADGMQHVWTGRRATNERDFAIFDGLRWT